MFFFIILILILKIKIKIENFTQNFDDILNAHCFKITSGSKEDYDKGECKTANCSYEYCNELIPGTQQYVMKKQRQLLINGQCVSKNNGKNYKCNRLPIPSENTCDSTNHCFEFRNGIWEKDFYRKELEDDGNCNWKNIKTNELQTQEYLDNCLKNKFTCYQYNNFCPSSQTKIRFGLDNSDSTGMTCTEINNCDTCNELTLTCANGITYTQKQYNGECNFFDDFNNSIPDTCDGIEYALNCKDRFECNGKTYSSITENPDTCVYQSTDGKKIYTDKCIPIKNCNTWQFYDIESNTCKACPFGQYLTNNDGKSVTEACGPIPACTESDTCWTLINGSYQSTNYPFTFKNGACSSNKPSNCLMNRPIIETHTAPAPSPPPPSTSSIKCKDGFKKITFKGNDLCIWAR